MKRMTLSVSVVFVFTFVLSAMMYDAYAVPTFARKHNMPCSACHAAFPKLNEFGKQFRENGYRMPGDEGTYIFKEPVPISAAINVAWESESKEANSIDFEEARLFAGGTLAPEVSYYADLKLFEKEPSAAVKLQEAVSGEHIQAFVIFDDIFPDLIPKGYANVAIGVRELDLPVSPMRRLTESQYLIYNTMPEAMDDKGTPMDTADDEMFMNGLMFMTPQTGIEIKGNLPQGLHYGVSLINGRGSLTDNNDRKDIYGNIRYTRNGHTIGILGYSGKNVLADVTDPSNVGTGPNADITRYALSADFNLQRLNLFGMYMLMKDSYDEELMYSAMDGAKERKFTGWFVEADYLLKPGLVAALRWDSVSDDDNEKDQTQATANLNYLFAENVKCHLEYSQLETDEDFNLSDETTTQKKYLARVSYAF